MICAFAAVAGAVPVTLACVQPVVVSLTFADTDSEMKALADVSQKICTRQALEEAAALKEAKAVITSLGFTATVDPTTRAADMFPAATEVSESDAAPSIAWEVDLAGVQFALFTQSAALVS